MLNLNITINNKININILLSKFFYYIENFNTIFNGVDISLRLNRELRFRMLFINNCITEKIIYDKKILSINKYYIFNSF
jgi:hypothetical protein